MNNRNLTPIFLAVSVVVGILIGTFYASHFMGNRLNIINTGTNKLNYLLQLVDNNYVDTVDMSQMVEDAMPLILSELDPHSAYIPAKDAEAETQDLKGSFSGVGITFSMVNDTVNVMSIIKGGPAEKVGEMPTEMFFHFFKSLSDAARMNLNIKAEGENEHHKIEGIFKALARALKMAVKRDIEHFNLPSSKGTL